MTNKALFRFSEETFAFNIFLHSLIEKTHTYLRSIIRMLMVGSETWLY